MIQRPLILPIRNMSGEVMPPYAAVRLSGQDKDGIYYAYKPDRDSDTTVRFNGRLPISDGAVGSANNFFPCPALYSPRNELGADPATGDEWGTAADDWCLHKEKHGFKSVIDGFQGITTVVLAGAPAGIDQCICIETCTGQKYLRVVGGTVVSIDDVACTGDEPVPSDPVPCATCDDIFCAEIPIAFSSYMRTPTRVSLTRVSECFWQTQVTTSPTPDSPYLGSQVVFELIKETDRWLYEVTSYYMGMPITIASYELAVGSYSCVGSITLTGGASSYASIWPTSVTLTQGACAPPIDGTPVSGACDLVARWIADEGAGTTLGDDTANANNLTTSAATWSLDTPGAMAGAGGSISFTSGSDSYDALVATNLPTGDSARTQMFWAKFSSASTSSLAVLSYGTTAYSRLILQYNGVSTQIFGDGTQSVFVNGDARGTYGEWHHYAIAYSAGSFAFYRDGVLEAFGTLASALATTGIFSEVYGSAAVAETVLIKDARIYDCALSAAAISSIISPTPSTSFAVTPGLVQVTGQSSGAGAGTPVVDGLVQVTGQASGAGVSAATTDGLVQVTGQAATTDPTIGGNVEYTAPGSYSYTVAAEGNHILESWGGGGGGGGGDSGTGGDGGGAGEHASETVYLYVGDVLSVVVGGGGTGGTAGNSGVGGDSGSIASFSGTSFTTVMANGGSGGAPAGLGTGGQGGTGSANTTHTDGGDGSTGNGSSGGTGGTQGSYTGAPGGTGASAGSTSASVSGGGGGGPTNGDGGSGGAARAKITAP